MGLREQKQRVTRQSIIENAVALYRQGEPGRDPLRVRDISAQTGISDATFFNYFGSRDAVFREWAQDLIDAAFVQAAARCTAGEGIRRVVRGLADRLVDRVVDEGPVLVFGLGLISVVPGPLAPAASRGRVEEPDGALLLVEAGVARDEIRSDVPAAQLAELLRAAVVGALARGVVDAQKDVASALVGRIRLAADVVLDGMRKRNERVRPGVRPGAARSAQA